MTPAVGPDGLELDAREGDQVKATDQTRIGTVDAVNYAGRSLDIKKRMDARDVHPDAVIFQKQVDSGPFRESIM